MLPCCQKVNIWQIFRWNFWARNPKSFWSLYILLPYYMITRLLEIWLKYMHHSQGCTAPKRECIYFSHIPHNRAITKAQCKLSKFVSRFVNMVPYFIASMYMEMYRKCGQPKSNLISHWLKLVWKWPMANCYFVHCITI